MTYREMFESMSEEQLNQTVTVYDDKEDEFFPATVEITSEDDILDANHVYLTINREDDSLIVP